jgi:hypothetical protein
LECIGINLTSSSIVLLGELTHHLPELIFFLSGCCRQGLLWKWIHRGEFTRLHKRGKKKIYCLRKKQTTETFGSLRQVDIMKRLRHPNVLLFMGAIYSQEKHAIVTELLPR